jgi:hypothetical protein
LEIPLGSAGSGAEKQEKVDACLNEPASATQTQPARKPLSNEVEVSWMHEC